MDNKWIMWPVWFLVYLVTGLKYCIIYILRLISMETEKTGHSADYKHIEGKFQAIYRIKARSNPTRDATFSRSHSE